jgi:hypothetical protein
MGKPSPRVPLFFLFLLFLLSCAHAHDSRRVRACAPQARARAASKLAVEGRCEAARARPLMRAGGSTRKGRVCETRAARVTRLLRKEVSHSLFFLFPCRAERRSHRATPGCSFHLAEWVRRFALARVVCQL